VANNEHEQDGVSRREFAVRVGTAAAGVAMGGGKTEEFVNDKQADQLLTREYRTGFEVPGSFGGSSHHQANR
jgi:hypothetical protein